MDEKQQKIIDNPCENCKTQYGWANSNGVHTCYEDCEKLKRKPVLKSDYEIYYEAIVKERLTIEGHQMEK